MMDFERIRWITSQTRFSRSPIFEWSSSLVQKALAARFKEGCLAKVREKFPVFLTHFDWFFLKHAIKPIIKCILPRGFDMLGEASNQS